MISPQPKDFVDRVIFAAGALPHVDVRCTQAEDLRRWCFEIGWSWPSPSLVAPSARRGG